MEVACMDGVNIEKNEKKDALLIAIEEGRTIVKDPNAPTGFPVIFKIIYVTIYQMYLSGKGEYWFVFIVGHNNPNLIL